MSKRTQLILICSAAVVLLYAATITTLNFVNIPKVAYIDTSVLMDKYPGAMKAREDLKKKTDDWKKNIETLQAELNKLNEDMIKNASSWSRATLAKKEETMKQKQSEYAKYSRAISEKAAQAEKDAFAPVYSELNARIADFGKDKHYDIILGTVTGGNILYAQEATDLTDMFLEYVSSKNI